jgi:hypothetical protein
MRFEQVEQRSVVYDVAHVQWTAVQYAEVCGVPALELLLSLVFNQVVRADPVIAALAACLSL